MSTFDYQQIRARITRFRILIVGRRNAGKTTILQRVCNTTEQPEIYDAKGNKIAQDTIAPTYERGLHNIENELVFKSNLGFVFHDSRGFEAGRPDELKVVQDFIALRSREKEMNGRIHAIWYCIPVDDDRPITIAEKHFFSECGTGIVPVVVVFTKMHAQDAKEYQKAGRPTDFSHLRDSAVAFVEGNYLKELTKMKYRPKSSVCLGEIKADNMNCSTLIEKTLSVLNNFTLKMLLVMTQQISKKINIKFAIEEIIITLLKEKGTNINLSSQVYIVVLGWIEKRDNNWDLEHNKWNLEVELNKHCLSFSKFQQLLDQTVSTPTINQSSIMIEIACKALALLVISLYGSALFSSGGKSSPSQCLIKALTFHMEQIQSTNIAQGIQQIVTEFQAKMHWYTKKTDKVIAWKGLSQQLLDLVLGNQLPINNIEEHAKEAAIINLEDWKQ